MNSYFHGRFLVSMCALLAVSQPVQAFFCLSFGFGGNGSDRYRRLPPTAPFPRYTPHPSAYLLNNHPASPTLGLQYGGYPYPPFSPSAAVPAPAYSSVGGDRPNRTK